MKKSRKFLSPDGLWKTVCNFFSREAKKKGFFEEKKKNTAADILDCLMACCAIFSLKLPSLLQYDKRRNDDLSANLTNLFHVKKPPSDTTMRERLDEVEPSKIRGVFKTVFAQVQRGKGLEQYKFYDDHYLVGGDGTGHFSSHEVFCKNCCVKNHKSGETTYYHNMLSMAIIHPDIKRVIPFAPEPITKQDGASKNDCEQNAAKRFLTDFRREHPHLKVILAEDSLYSTGPHIKLLNQLNIRFIINAKPGNLQTLFAWVRALDDEDMKSTSFIDRNGTEHKFRYVNNVPLNDSNSETMVNFVEYWEILKNGKTKYFSWITDILLEDDNVKFIMRGGRARWNIENCTFNTLKNQGYNFNHNFGHGQKNLCDVMGLLMMLAFFIDQVSELFNELFQKARKREITYYSLWEAQRMFFRRFIFKTWDELYEAIVIKKKLVLNSS